MTSASSGNAPRRSRAPLAVTAAIIAALVIAFFMFAGFYTDILWYDQLGFVNVL
ncbi:MAG: rane protein, partial [Cryobacterium sp.]|nr:rane protein [Cryobacterium sp.]